MNSTGQKPKQKPSRRHHFIAEMLQKRFCDGSGRIHFFDKRFPAKGISSTIPRYLYVQSHLYTLHNKSGDKNVEAETEFFSKLDGLGDKLIQRIVSCARQRQTPGFSPDDKAAWDLFFYYQWKRVPDVIDNNDVIKNFEAEIEELLAEYEKTVRQVTEDERRQLSDPKTLRRMKQNTKVQAAVYGVSEEVRTILAQKGIAIALLRKPNKSFILGSYPIVKLTHPGRSHLSDPSVEVWFPIASDVAVTPAFGPGEERLVIVDEPRHVRGINEAIFKQSTTIAGRSKQLIASLACI